MTEWEFNDRPVGVAFVEADLPAEQREALDEQIWTWIVHGCDEPADFVDFLTDGQDLPGDVVATLTTAYERAIAARLAQQAAWGQRASSNLGRAFAELDDHGVLARESFTCCGTCARDEIHDEREDGRSYLGYTYYHQQDAESLLASDDGRVYLGYGAYPPADFDQAAYDALEQSEQEAIFDRDVTRVVRGTIIPVLRRHGLEVTWNGDLGTRILVTGAQCYLPLQPPQGAAPAS